MPNHTNGYRTAGREVPAGLLALIGVGLGALVLEFLFTHPLSPLWWRVEFFVTTSIAATIAYCGYWLARSDYESRDLWAILGWCLGGLACGLLLAGGIYVHQTVERVSIADLPFLFESLALIGAGAGVAFGLSRHADSTRHLDPGFDAPDGDGTEALWQVLSLLGGDVDALYQRWTLVESLTTKSVREVPTKAFIVQLTATEAFPDDEREVATLVEQEHLPVLVETGLVEVHEDRGTISYVGPESVAESLSTYR